MPDLSLSRQELLQQSLRHSKAKGHGVEVIGGVEFNHSNQKLTVANNLFQTVIKGNINKVRHLLARGVSVNAKSDYGFSPLVAALHIEDPQKRSKMFCLLLEKGAVPTAKDTNKRRPVLHWACVLGQTEQVIALLEETAGDIDLSERDDDGYTALHHAVKIGNPSIVEKLVEFHIRFGVSVDAADKMGLTPYLHARRLGYRDVAAILKDQGLASLGHGDNLFRSPREWSQIGKFERRKAIDLDNLGRINVAKIMGKPTLMPLLENSPRMAVPGIVVPSYRPERNGGILRRKPPHHLSNSLPSLSQAEPMEGNDRPLTATKGDRLEGVDHSGRPGPPKVAFANEQLGGSKSSFKSDINGQQFSTHNNGLSKTANSVTTSSGNSTMVSSNNIYHNSDQGILKASGNYAFVGIPKTFDNGQNRTSFAPPVRSGSNMAALNLLQQTTKGRVVNQFHHSEFDKTKSTEYKHMLGNLNNIMDVLSQQQTKSFRKSVEVRKPETPPKIKKKSKVSTLAIIFGHNGRRRSGHKKKSKSPASDKKDNKTKDKKGKAPSSGKQKKQEKAKGIEQPNKLPVPTIRIN